MYPQTIYLALAFILSALPAISQAGQTAERSDEAAIVEHVSHILTTLDIRHEKTIASVTQASQVFRRKSGVERWQVKEPSVTDKQRAEIFSALTALHFIDTLNPSARNYDAVVILGATMGRMENRIQMVERLIAQGVKFRRIVFLTTQRPLDPAVDNIPELKKKLALKFGKKTTEISSPLTETEAARQLLEASGLSNRFDDQSILFIDTPRKLKEGKFERGNTRDSINTWMARKPAIKKILLISNQPHAHYQLEAARKSLPTTVSADMAADQTGTDTSISNALDAMALWLHNLPNT